MRRLMFPCLETYSKLQGLKQHGMGLHIIPRGKGCGWSAGMKSLKLVFRSRVESHSREEQSGQPQC